MKIDREWIQAILNEEEVLVRDLEEDNWQDGFTPIGFEPISAYPYVVEKCGVRDKFRYGKVLQPKWEPYKEHLAELSISSASSDAITHWAYRTARNNEEGLKILFNKIHKLEEEIKGEKRK